MKETELRIGNLIFFNDDNNTICVIESIKRDFDDEPYSVEIKFKDGMFSDVNIEDIKPIPLTEEWLLKLGFENKGLFINKVALMGEPSGDMDGSILFQIGEYGQEIYLLNGKYDFQIDVHNDDFGTLITTKEIEYLHQLQNLYFALTGQELTIKEKETA